MKIRLRKLHAIEELLLDLTNDLKQVTGLCSVCGAYRSENLSEAAAARELFAMKQTISEMQEAAWAKEESV